MAVVCGKISSREFNGRHYTTLKGDQFNLVENAVVDNNSIQDVSCDDGIVGSNLDGLDISGGDDLPF